MTAVSFPMLAQSWRMLWRDWRSGELSLLLFGLVLAVCAVSSVGFLSDRVQRSLERDAAQLLGADLVIQSDRPLPDTMQQWAQALQLKVLTQLNFPSMAFAASQDAKQKSQEDFTVVPHSSAQLVSVKAVQSAYPLRGALKVSDGPRLPEQVAKGGPVAGTVWVDALVLSALSLKVGDFLMLGDARLRIAKVIVVEPDRGLSFINLAPRLLMSIDDISDTRLIQPGSRITYRLLVAGPPRSVERFRQDIEPLLGAGQRLETLENARPEVRETLDRAKQFLSLTALLTAFIAGIAIFLSARRYVVRHWDSVAVMRCFGLSQRQLMTLFTFEFACVGLLGVGIGATLGVIAHYGLLAALADLLPAELAPPSIWPFLQAVAFGLILTLACVLAPLSGLKQVSALDVLRRQVVLRSFTTQALIYSISAGLLLLLMISIAQNVKLGLWTGAIFIGALTTFVIGGALITLMLAPLLKLSLRPVVLRFALAGLVRRRGSSLTQIAALSLGLMAILMLTLSRNDLISGWQRSLSPMAPDHFIINIQPDQRTLLLPKLQTLTTEPIELSPMIRGRLVQHNGIAVRSENYAEERAQRLIDREFNLSYRSTLPSFNRLQAGKWLDPQGAEISMESGIAETLGIKLGDRLTFEVAGIPIQVTVTSLRKLAWDSMRVNFFALLSPAALKNAPASYITALRLNPKATDTLAQLVSQFPNLTIIDTAVILRQLQTVLAQVVGAIQYLFLFALAAGGLVLYTALIASRDARLRESALLRTLGASSQQLHIAHMLELSLIGIVAGAMAAVASWGATQLLAKYIFVFEVTSDWRLWPIGLIGGWVCALLGGWQGLKGIVSQPPWQVLRKV